MIAKDVFLTAMALMDQESEDGTYDGYPDEYKKKSWSVLTILQAEILPASATPEVILNENSTFQLDDRTARTCLPYGLAAHLILEEDQNKASFFNARYDELKSKRPATISSIKDVYWGGGSSNSGGGNSGGNPGGGGGNTGGGEGNYDGGEF